jgi:Predicted metal-dependent hydrolase
MIFNDDEFGEVVVRKSLSSTNVKFSLAPDRRLRISAPTYMSDRRIRRLLDTSRTALRSSLLSQMPKRVLKDGQRIGKSYTVVFVDAEKKTEIVGKQVLVASDSEEVEMKGEICDIYIKALRNDAKEYLPKKLKVVAERCEFHYELLRLSHASSRWGSCSSNGTISLNITLMNLPEQLIDYVLIHELVHTKHMNHSAEFWREVEKHDHNYKRHRKALKMFSPFI